MELSEKIRDDWVVLASFWHHGSELLLLSQMFLVAGRNRTLSWVATNEPVTHFLHPHQSPRWEIKPKTILQRKSDCRPTEDPV